MSALTNAADPDFEVKLERLTLEVLNRLRMGHRSALLVGRLPTENVPFRYVSEAPYDVVVIGELKPSELLSMPTEEVCQALLTGMPVYLGKQSYYKGRNGILLRKELLEAEQRLLRFGVRPLGNCVGACERYDDRNSDRKPVGDQKV